MKVNYYKEYSKILSRDMEFKTYGEEGLIFIYFPSQYQRFYEIEDKKVIDKLSYLIENKKMIVISIDNIDLESISSNYWDKRVLLERQEQYFNYFVYEFYPKIYEIFHFKMQPIAFGMSFGAYQSLNFFLRKPHLFSGVFALSGIYNIRFFTNNYFDKLAFLNSPIDSLYLLNNQEYIEEIKKKKIVVVCSYGPYEDTNQTIELEKAFKYKNINNAEFYYWGESYPHDFPSWFIYIDFYINKFIS